MKIICRTNIDAYRNDCFPHNLVHVPRIGEKVAVRQNWETYFNGLKLPTSLRVVDVTHNEQIIFVELWYSETDVKLYDIKAGHGL